MRNSKSIQLALSLCTLLVLLAAGCKPDLLPGTKIEDTPLNRAILDFMDQYKQAVEERSAQAVLKLVAESYFEDLGTADEADDYGIRQLSADLEQNFAHAEVVQLKIDVQHIEPVEDSDRVNVYYRYMQRALLDLPSGDQWVSHSDVNRMVLKMEGSSPDDGFSIISGL